MLCVHLFESGVLEDQGFSASGLELDDGFGHGSGGGDFLDAAKAELGMADEDATFEFAYHGISLAVLGGGFDFVA